MDDIELNGLANTRATAPNEVPRFTLPRADGGKDAWLVLTACFILEALVWGEPSSFQ